MEKNINKFQQTAKQWEELNKQLYQDCKDYLASVLPSQPDKTVEFTDCDDFTCVTYNGGPHPEYDANPYSQVERIYMKDDGKIYMDIEDDTEYSIDNICAMELYDVTNMVEALI